MYTKTPYHESFQRRMWIDKGNREIELNYAQLYVTPRSILGNYQVLKGMKEPMNR